MRNYSNLSKKIFYLLTYLSNYESSLETSLFPTVKLMTNDNETKTKSIENYSLRENGLKTSP